MVYLTKLKPGVYPYAMTPQTAFAIMVAERVWFSVNPGADFVITSLFDGKHKAGSKHYSGDAFDFRIRTISQEKQGAIKRRLSDCLGDCWDVVLESDHFHIEYDPHRKAD